MKFGSSSRVHSPISQSQTPAEAISSPDLVSIPNQNFVWQLIRGTIAKQVIKGDTQVHIHAHVLIHAHAEIRQ
jgi:hypothetical protein